MCDYSDSLFLSVVSTAGYEIYLSNAYRFSMEDMDYVRVML